MPLFKLIFNVNDLSGDMSFSDLIKLLFTHENVVNRIIQKNCDTKTPINFVSLSFILLIGFFNESV
ncbi:uncharacterized protein METZ01_LOCUS253693 [marine metagenome]|uniref:Uncharacterized protein n=1 Tax=marine metagenome TaxID=408172 RepID=A0A382INJ7_9ZZZZ